MRYTQPQSGPAEIDWGAGISRGLVLDALPFDRFRDRVRKATPASTVGNVAISATNVGAARTFASSVLGFGDVELFTGAQLTFQVIEQPNNLTQVAGLVNKRLGGASSNSISFGYNYNGGNEFTVDIGNSAGTAVGTNYQFNRTVMSTVTPNILLIVIDGQAGATAKVKLYRNGVSVPYLTSITDTSFTALANTTSPLEIGRVNNAALYYAGRISLVRAWNRALSLDEIKSISDNPWQIYESQPSLILSAAAVSDPTGTFSSTLAGAGMTSAGTTTNNGAFASTMAGATMASSGSVGGAPDGTFASTLAGATMASSGQLLAAGSFSSALAGASMSSSGAILDRGTFASTLDGAAMTSNGTVATNATGTFSSSLAGATMIAYGYNGIPPVLAGLSQRLPKNPRHVLRLP